MGSLVSGARYFRDLLEATKWGGGGVGVVTISTGDILRIGSANM